jgi:hypothetical protein
VTRRVLWLAAGVSLVLIGVGLRDVCRSFEVLP